MAGPNLTLRRDKGSRLTKDEVDDNWQALLDFGEAIEDRIDVAVTEDGSLRNPKVVYGVANSGTDAYAVSVDGEFTTIDQFKGVVLLLLPDVSNTGAATVNPNVLGAKNIVKDHGLALDNCDLVVSKIAVLEYNGTDFQLLNPRSNGQANYGTDTGAADAYKIEFADLAALSASRFQMPAALYAGYRATFKASADNTGASTFEIKITAPATSLTGAIKKNGTQALIAGDIKSGQTYEVLYDGTNWQMSALNGTRSFRATSIAIRTTNGAMATQAHGLGGVPDVFHFTLKCKGNAVAHGYTIGDRVGLSAVMTQGDNADVLIPYANTTVLGMSVRVIPATGITIQKQDASGYLNITPAELAADFDFEMYAAITN